MGNTSVVAIMGEITTKVNKVKLVCGIITSGNDLYRQALIYLEESYGSFDFISGGIPFEGTDYYRAQMGDKLIRWFVSFKNLIPQDALPKIKHETNKIEIKLSRIASDIQRPINLDPGYITEAKLVLASTKDFCHRIYINKGIYAEVTLSFKKKSFVPCENTYPDYRTNTYISIFNHIRSLYACQIHDRVKDG